MIRAAKHLNLDACVIHASARLLSILQAKRVCRYDELRATLKDLSTDADVLFLPTVHFLFLLGRVNYHAQTDSFEYLQPVSGV